MGIRKVGDDYYGDNKPNVIKGTSRSNYIEGRGGDDDISGAGGHDIIDGGSGHDLINAGAGNDFIDGGRGNDRIIGGAGGDFLGGGFGQDILTGGRGQDAFVFDTKPGLGHADIITDFNVKDDTILLDHKAFAKAGNHHPSQIFTLLKKSAFWTGEAAHDANDRIIYNKNTGEIFYDADGTGAKAAILFATVKAGLGLTFKDFALF